jgi:REP element-mobilizing transposase RayT
VQLVGVGFSRGESNFHLIFTPKYRRDVFRDNEVRRICLECFARACYQLSIKMEACEFGPDHVRLFVSLCKNYSTPYMVQRFKGASAHRIRQEMWEHVKGKL